MDWYCESDSADLTVLKDEEIFDRLPSPDSWSSWGKIVGNFKSSKKSTVLGVKELLSREATLLSEVEQLVVPSICPGFEHSFCQQSAYPHEYSDAQLNDLPIIDEADDIFFHSLFVADANAIEGADSFTQTSSKDDLVSVVKLSGERNRAQGCTIDVENASPFPPAKELELEICFSEERSILCDDIIDDSVAMEESVLLELQRLTLQLAKKTRICFRDSLYRLAENSRYQTKCGQHVKEGLKNCKPTTSSVPSRLQKHEAKKSETNAIDRTVASFLFNTMEFGNQAEASTAEMAQGEYEANSCFYQPSSFIPSIYTVPGGYAEVPIFRFGLMNQPLPPPRGHTHFSTNSLVWSCAREMGYQKASGKCEGGPFPLRK